MRIRAVILDWAGTTVDYGSNAPVAAFLEAFGKFGILPTMEETRAPMGMQKRAHIERMLAGERLSALWMEKVGRPHTAKDIDALYAAFEPALLRVLEDFAVPLPGVLDAVRAVRGMGVKIGSTTGYTAAMMDIVAPAAARYGYAPDCLVCPDETGGIGRPFPYMLWRNMEKLGMPSARETVKIGDTVADVEEGKNAGCVSVGILKGSNMLGLSEREFSALSPKEAAARLQRAREGYVAAGADLVLEDIAELPAMLKAF